MCGSGASQRCSRCHVTSYCGRDHQKQHWRTHKMQCRPYEVAESPELGRYLTASRDVAAGDVLLKDVPLVIGPRQITMPVCVGCSSPVDGSHSCSDCGWPLCNPECQQVILHQPECQASRARESKVLITKFYQLNEMFECITPLRCLWLKKSDPRKWDELMSMESHLEERKKSKATELDKCNVIDFVRGYLKFQDFTDEELYKICGILEVNGFEIPAPNFVGLYGRACLLEHSCLPNTLRTFDVEMNVIIRAAVDIKKGEHLTTSYTDPMWGTSSRQMHLRTTKYFQCQCKRCLDPTELGTNFSSIKCNSCRLLVTPPADTSMEWLCSSCGSAISAHEASELLKRLGERLANLRGNLLDSEEFLTVTNASLGENHHYRTEVKLALAQIIGKQNQSQLAGLSEQQLKRKLELCKESLSLVNFFQPGLTRLHGLLHFEMAMSLWELHRRQSKVARTTREAAQDLQRIEKYLREANSILSFESPLQDEHQVALQAAEVLNVVIKAKKKCKAGNPKKTK